MQNMHDLQNTLSNRSVVCELGLTGHTGYQRCITHPFLHQQHWWHQQGRGKKKVRPAHKKKWNKTATTSNDVSIQSRHLYLAAMLPYILQNCAQQATSVPSQISYAARVGSAALNWAWNIMMSVVTARPQLHSHCRIFHLLAGGSTCIVTHCYTCYRCCMRWQPLLYPFF